MKGRAESAQGLPNPGPRARSRGPFLGNLEFDWHTATPVCLHIFYKAESSGCDTNCMACKT